MIHLLIAAMWVVSGLVLCVGGLFAIPFVGIVVTLAWMAAGLVPLIASLWLARRRERRIFALGVAVATAVLGFGILASEVQLERFGDDLRFAAARPKYEMIVRRLEEGQAEPGERYHLGIEYDVDEGPPRRVAFPLPNSLVDNWCAVVYDATGSLMTPSPSVRMVFGGDLVGCKTLSGTFFRCCFT